MLASFVCAVAGGLCMWLAQEPIGLWPLAFLALALLWIATTAAGIVRAAFVGFVWGCAYFIPLFMWASQAAGTWIATVALAVAESLFLGILGALWSLAHTHRAVLAASLAGVFWVAIEELRSAWPFGGMPWGLSAFALVDSPLMGFAPVGSTQLVGFTAAAIGVLFGTAIIGMHTIPGRSIVLAASATIIMFAPAFMPTGVKPDDYLRVGVVQGNVPDEATVQAGESSALIVTRNHTQATRTLLDTELDLIVWPESASDRDIRVDTEASAVVMEVAAQSGVPIVMGTQRYVENARYNDYLVVYPDGTITEPYSKSHPVPFGEYIPHREFFRSITPAVDQIRTDMLPGEGPALLNVETARGPVTMSVPICFEIAYNGILDDSVSQGAQLIVTPTNNASFGNSGQPHQQFAMARFRAEEFGRSVIQVSTSGISGAVEPNGVVTYQTDLFGADARVVTVALASDETFATGKESIRVWASYLLGGLGLLWCVGRRFTE